MLTVCVSQLCSFITSVSMIILIFIEVVIDLFVWFQQMLFKELLPPFFNSQEDLRHGVMLNIGEKDIIEEANGIDHEQLVSNRNEVEVDALNRRPETVIDNVGRNEITPQFTTDVLPFLAFHHGDARKEQPQAYRTEYECVSRHLGHDHAPIASAECLGETIEIDVPHMTHWTHTDDTEHGHGC